MVCSHCWARSWNNWTAMICLGPISVSAYAFTYHYSVWIISICKLLKSKAYFIKSLSCLFLVKSNVWDLYLKDIIIFFFFCQKNYLLLPGFSWADTGIQIIYTIPTVRRLFPWRFCRSSQRWSVPGLNLPWKHVSKPDPLKWKKLYPGLCDLHCPMASQLLS